jgi:hypothetical protein
MNDTEVSAPRALSGPDVIISMWLEKRNVRFRTDNTLLPDQTERRERYRWKILSVLNFVGFGGIE